MNDENPSSAHTKRQFDLDWLRIIAFSILIFYHIAQLYSGDQWHVKSTYASDEWFPYLALINAWRLPLLFFISGVAIHYLIEKVGTASFAKDRLVRLTPVIVFGMLVVVAPQTWFEVRYRGLFDGTFLEFYAAYVVPSNFQGIITPTYNHLWYVVYLLVYSLILCAAYPILKTVFESSAFSKISTRFNSGSGIFLTLFAPTILFLLYRYLLVPHFPTTYILIDDWANNAIYFTYLLIGFFYARNYQLMCAVDKAWPFAFLLTVGIGIGLFIAYQRWDMVSQTDHLLFASQIGRVLYSWFVILTLLGMARKFLGNDNGFRRYLTNAVFPFYIIHQTVIVAIGFYANSWGFSLGQEFSLVTAVTIGSCILGYEFVRRIKPLRPVFGLKW